MSGRLPVPPSPATVLNTISANMIRRFPALVKRLPKPPFFIQKKVAEKILQTLLAEQIEMEEFDFLEGHFLQLCIEDMGLSFLLSFENNQLILSDSTAQADVIFRGSSREFLLLASRMEDPDTLFFQRRLVIEGDTELGLYIKNSIDGIDYDHWPRWLNQLIGKVARLVNEQDEAVNVPQHGQPAVCPPENQGLNNII